MLQDQHNLSREDARLVFNLYEKERLLKRASIDRYTVKHGGLLDRDVVQRAVLLARGAGLQKNGARTLDKSIKIREAFYDKPHSRKQKVSWTWPEEMVEVGDCEAILYTSNKWQKDGKMIDYKHVKEGEQKLLLRPDIAFTGDADEMFGPIVDLVGEFPDSFAVLATTMGIQARLYSNDEGTKYGDYVDLKFSKSTLGAGKFDDGATFCFVYDHSGVLAVVIGAKLDVIKDGIVG